MSADTLKLIALVLPLGLDTFGVALALGIAGLPGDQRVRVALLFAGFEAAMPLVGVALGAPIGNAAGAAADYLAGAVLIGLGVYVLSSGKDEPDRALSLTEGGLFGAVVLGVSISLDELAIGFSAGLLRLPLVPLVVAIAVQALAVTLLGVHLGSRVGERWRESAERVAGAALIALGSTLLILRAT